MVTLLMLNSLNRLASLCRLPSRYSKYLTLNKRLLYTRSQVKSAATILPASSQSNVKGKFDDLILSLEASTKVSKKFVRPAYLSVKVNDIVAQLCDNVHSLTTELWLTINKECCENERYLITNHWPTPVLLQLINHDTDPQIKIKIADWMIEQMNTQGTGCEPEKHTGETVMSMSAYMAILSTFGFGVKESEILERYKLLCKRTDNIYEPIMGKLVLQALSQTSRWRECYKVIEELSLFSNVRMDYYNDIVIAAAICHDYGEVWKLFTLYKEKYAMPSPDTFETLIRNCSPEIFKSLVKHISEHNWIVDQPTALLIAEKLKDSDPTARWSRNMTYANTRGGACTKCGHTLDKFVTLPNQLFEKLKVEVMDKALLRDDVYLNTTPEELEHFTRFLASNPPFDVIVDGMNCLYTLADGKRAAYKSSSLKMIKFLQRLAVDMKWRVLVTFRKHISGGVVSEALKDIPGITVYFTNNNTADDPYFIYAAFHSGPHCKIATRDYLRTESFLLGDDLRHWFKLWQRQNQLSVHATRTNNNQSREISFKWPWAHQTNIQCTPDGNKWHIPYEDQFKRPSYQPPNGWICLHRKQ